MPAPTPPSSATDELLLRLLRIQARANRLMNHRLHQAMAPLTPAELQAPRVSFFPSLLGTLNHILEVDGYYVGALAGDDVSAHWDQFAPATDLPELAARQRDVDQRLVAFCDDLDTAGCTRVIALPRAAGRVQRDRVVHVLAHLHMHQIHHRGQVHAMLSGTALAPPQLDEFLMPSEGELRRAEMSALGWDEAAVYGVPP
jgi:uncharacterized damage-inducible protein DinB